VTVAAESHVNGLGPEHWPSKHQQPPWPDLDAVTEVAVTLSDLPPLVSAHDCDTLRTRLAAVARGDAFVLQGGDCAELFMGTRIEPTARKLRCLADMAAILASASDLPVVTVGRIAGQYAKPRSVDTETREGKTLPVYRGDAVNDVCFGAEPRTPDPRRLLGAYRASERILHDIGKLRSTDAALFRDLGGDVFTSHEALLLPYEDALARTDPTSGRRYGLSGHLLWIGERTRQLDGPHLAFAAGVHNPVAVKLGPTADRATIAKLVELLDPRREPGRLAFIARLGADAICDLLPGLVEEAIARGSAPTWVCDPMHGNTFVTLDGRKTRRFETILAEVEGFFAVHRALGTHPGGLHLELTSRAVTECVDHRAPIQEKDLRQRYESACDPRLNGTQALELAHLVAPLLRPGPFRHRPPPRPLSRSLPASGRARSTPSARRSS